MVAKSKNDPLAWFKLDCGSYIAETTGLSNTHVGIYIRLLCLYWSTNNNIDSLTTQQLKRRTNTSDSEEDLLSEVLDEFFPLDETGKRSHQRLDSQLGDIKAFSAEQSLRGKLAHRKKTPNPPTAALDDDYDF